MADTDLTLFSLPKPFTGHIGAIQRNAVHTWVRLVGPSRIMLMGADVGIEEICKEMDLRHVPHLPTTELGTPLLDEAFRIAQHTSETELVGYINADILLPEAFLTALQAIQFERFIAVGNRWNVDVPDGMELGSGDVERDLAMIADKGELQPARGSDYFVFRRGTLGDLPPFAVGRPGWDNWLIYHARASGLPVVDLSPHVLVLHQNHDYSHVPNRVGSGWEGPEADENRRLIGGWDKVFTLHDATHVVDHGRVRRATSYPYLRRRLSAAPVLHPWLEPLAEIVRFVRRRGR